MSKNILNWQKIYLDYSPKLLGICRRYITDLQAAEDIVQDSFMTAMQKDHQLKDEKAIFGWLKKIVVNNALQMIRKTSKETFITTEPSEIPDTLTEMTTSAPDDKKHILAYDFTRAQLLQSIDNLPSQQKSVFNLYFIENYSHAEISQMMEIPVNTSKSHLLRAKKSVQNYLLTHFVSKETPKNKMALLLIFFGFGNSLWGRTFQSKFSDFAIVPQKSFNIPSDSAVNQVSFSSATSFLTQNLIIGSTAVIIVSGTVAWFNQKNDSTKTSRANISKPMVKNEKPKITTLETESDKQVENNLITMETVADKTDQEKIEAVKEETKSTSKKQIIQIKDSAEKPAQQIVVVKKVIQRDTVFIER
ncbi:RNA polymerase sigma factor [Chryseobacterium foetidum]|uniref:RNA polymerase sigma factor n=1 Tax=Chryseobacterium foetidum TaxID=2951057 RepID=UPI0021CADA82|nr:RNA polymerase sigma factor [Chryseobacterium foetidum]